MFRSQGSERTDRQNRLVAGWLALIAGAVNSAGFVLAGTFTSHATGSVGRLANDLAAHDAPAATFALTLVVAFFAGAFVASMAIESNALGRAPFAYAAVLAAEGACLVAFTIVGLLVTAPGPRALDAEATLLSAAMGMQNSLVTRLSGAVVRTTHLTGVITDLGIELARWFRFWRGSIARRIGARLSLGDVDSPAPRVAAVMLLATIVAGFVSGAIGGSMLARSLGHVAMLAPACAVLATAVYAGVSGLRPQRGSRG